MISHKGAAIIYACFFVGAFIWVVSILSEDIGSTEMLFALTIALGFVCVRLVFFAFMEEIKVICT